MNSNEAILFCEDKIIIIKISNNSMMKNRKDYLKDICCYFLIITSSSIMSQVKMDNLTILDEDIKKEYARSAGLEYIKFKYIGEEVVYTISKKDIKKIEFANGRVEIIYAVEDSLLHSTFSKSVEGKHKIAVLPSSIILNDDRIQEDVFEAQLQNQVADILKEEIYNGLIVQDPETTNELLAKNNISRTSIANLLPEEIASVLGVEYIIYSTTSIINEKFSNYKRNLNRYEKNKKNKESGFFYSNSSVSDIDDVELILKIYEWNGIQMYSKSAHYPSGAFFVECAYKDELRSIIKHSPLGIQY